MSQPVPVSEKIRRARRARELTQEGLDDALGVPHGRTFAYEKGRATVPEVIVRRIAKALDIMPDWFFDGEDTPPPIGKQPPPESAMSLIPSGTPASPLGERGMVPTAGRMLFPILGSAGAAAAPARSAEADPDDFVEFSERLYRPERFAVRVSGHSGGEAIRHGDYLLVQPEEVPRHGFVTVLGRADEFVVKVAVRSPEGGFRFEAFDPEYPPIEIDGEWRIVGYACGLSRETRRGRYSEEGDDGGFTARKMANGRWGIE